MGQGRKDNERWGDGKPVYQESISKLEICFEGGGGWKIRGQIGGSRGNDTGVGGTLCKAGQQKERWQHSHLLHS